MANRNIQMNYYNGTDYDVLYPQSSIALISNLQASLNTKLNLSGGAMAGPLILNRNPVEDMEAVTKTYLENNSDINYGEIVFNEAGNYTIFINGLNAEGATYSRTVNLFNINNTYSLFSRYNFFVLSYHIIVKASAGQIGNNARFTLNLLAGTDIFNRYNNVDMELNDQYINYNNTRSIVYEKIPDFNGNVSLSSVNEESGYISGTTGATSFSAKFTVTRGYINTATCRLSNFRMIGYR